MLQGLLALLATRRPRPGGRRRTALVEPLEGRTLMAAGPAFTWKMQPRYGRNTDRDGRVDLPNTPDYANPRDGYRVILKAVESVVPRDGSRVSWVVTDSQGRETRPDDGRRTSVMLPEGDFSVRIVVTGHGNRSASRRADIRVDDILVVSMGDSFASGEGNPEISEDYGFTKYLVKKVFRADGDASRWATSPTSALASLDHRLAHRSTFAGPSRMARRLERADPHTSVTFVSVAQSVATIDRGLLGAATSVEDGASAMPPQVDQAAAIVGRRPVDVLTLSVGGNDVGGDGGLSRVIKALITSTATSSGLDAIGGETGAELAALPEKYRELDRRLRESLVLDDGQILITEYPDMFRDDAGEIAPIYYTDPDRSLIGRLARLTPLIGVAEAQFANDGILGPLNDRIRASSAELGWTFVDTVSARFRAHGYPAKYHWITRLDESISGQGDITGTFHPNRQGHGAIATSLLDATGLDLGRRRTPA